MSLSINISDKSNEPSVPRVNPTPSSEPKKRKTSLNIKTTDARQSASKTLRRSSKPKKRRSKKLYVFLFTLIVLIGCGAFVAKRMYSFSEEIGLDLKPADIINPIKKDPELKKDSSGNRTNVLLVGIDTRETNQGLQNTDTIIVGSYDYTKKEAVMISIPRDTYAAIPGTENYVKINGIYNWVENQEEGTGLEALVGVVEDYTGLEIQYYGMIDVRGFTNVIDIMGGVDVYVENSFTDYAYPDESNPYSDYQVVSFEAGPQTMDGETAIKYARSRKSLDNGEGSDFARARRQQNLLQAIKDKALSSETLLDPQKILDIMLEVEDNITVSPFTTEDIQAGLRLLEENGDPRTYSFVIDPYTGARNVVTEGAIPNSYAITPVEGIGIYDGVNAFVQQLLSTPDLYTEDPIIEVYDIGIGYDVAYQKTLELQEKYPYMRIMFMGTLFYDKEGNFVYDNSLDQDNLITPKFFAAEVGDATVAKPEFITNRLNGEDVTILLGAPVTLPPAETVPEGAGTTE